MKVYIVTQGQYSEYGIVAIYTTKKAAETHVKRGNEWQGVCEFSWTVSDYDMEEWELNTHDPHGNQIYHVSLYKNGDVAEVQARGVNESGFKPASTFVQYNTIYADKARPVGLFVDIWAKTMEQAVKAANEKRLYELAHDHWGINPPDYRYDTRSLRWDLWEGCKFTLFNGGETKPKVGDKVRFFYTDAGWVNGNVIDVSTTYQEAEPYYTTIEETSREKPRTGVCEPCSET